MAIQQTSANLVEELPPYVVSEAVQELADQVISETAGFRDLEDLRIVYLLRTDQPLDPDDEIDALVTVTKASPPVHGATGIDVLVAIKKANWDLWAEKQRRALLTHGLSHVLVTDEGKVKKIGHDAEVFLREVNEFGSWHPSLMRVARSFDEGPKRQPMQMTVTAGGRSARIDADKLEELAHDPTKVTELANRARRARESKGE